MKKFTYYLLIPGLLIGGSTYFYQKSFTTKPAAQATTQQPSANTATSTTAIAVATSQFMPASLEASTPRTETIDYTVKAGDTIGSIAQQFDISSATILLANNLSATSILKLNQKLSILPFSGITYKVLSGDSLSSIAKQTGVSADVILKTNNLTNNDGLKIGQLLNIPGAEKKITATPLNPKAVATTPAPTKSVKQPIATQRATSKTSPTPTKVTSVTWTSGALAELNKAPSFIRPSVRSKINSYAKSHGIKIITKQLYSSLRI